MLALDDAALMLVAGIATVTLAVLAAIYRPLVLECFDPQFLRSASGLSSPTHFTFLVLVVLNLVAGFQALGTLMAVGIMLLPAVAARFWAEDVSGMILVAVLIAFLSSMTGLLVSYYANLPTGPADHPAPAACSICCRSWSARAAGCSTGSCRASISKPDPQSKECRVMNKRLFLQAGLALALVLGLASGAEAADKLKAVASFSILGDMVKQVGGDRVDVVDAGRARRRRACL